MNFGSFEFYFRGAKKNLKGNWSNFWINKKLLSEVEHIGSLVGAISQGVDAAKSKKYILR